MPQGQKVSVEKSSTATVDMHEADIDKGGETRLSNENGRMRER
jgi:hypothetical protein